MSGDMARTQTMHIGPMVKPTVSAAEMQRRLDGLRRTVAELKLDAAIMTSYRNVDHFSDFLYCSFGRRFACVVTPGKALTVTPAIDAGQPWRRTFGDNVSYTDRRKDNVFHALQQALPKARRIGIELDHVSLDMRRLLLEAFPGAVFADVGQPAMWQRTVKSPEEVAVIKQGARIADLCVVACAATARAGVPVHEVARDGGVDGADAVDSRGHAGSGRLPRARHPGNDGGRGREHHQVSGRTGEERDRSAVGA